MTSPLDDMDAARKSAIHLILRWHKEVLRPKGGPFIGVEFTDPLIEWITNALAAVAQEGAIVGERTAEEPRTLPSSAFSIAQAEPEPKGVKMGDCPHGRNDWSVCTYCSQVLQADLTSARAALRLAQILFHGIQCQCEWCQHPAVQAALKETP